MYYDDEARRFNFASGLLMGAIVGTGLALVLGPVANSRKAPRHIRDTAQSARRSAGRGLGVAGERTRRASVSGLRAAADRLDR